MKSALHAFALNLALMLKEEVVDGPKEPVVLATRAGRGLRRRLCPLVHRQREIAENEACLTARRRENIPFQGCSHLGAVGTLKIRKHSEVERRVVWPGAVEVAVEQARGKGLLPFSFFFSRISVGIHELPAKEPEIRRRNHLEMKRVCRINGRELNVAVAGVRYEPGLADFEMGRCWESIFRLHVFN